jgi:hypothetical protein
MSVDVHDSEVPFRSDDVRSCVTTEVYPFFSTTSEMGHGMRASMPGKLLPYHLFRAVSAVTVHLTQEFRRIEIQHLGPMSFR